MIYKTLHNKPANRATRTSLKTGVNSGSLERSAVQFSLVYFFICWGNCSWYIFSFKLMTFSSAGFSRRPLITLNICNRLLNTFVLFILAIVLSVLLRYTDSDCPFSIFKLFFYKVIKCWYLFYRTVCLE